MHLTDLAEAQHGLIRHPQLGELTTDARRHLVRSGEWEWITPSVLRRTGTRRDQHQRAMAAVLDAGTGATLSHRTATTRWGLPGFQLEPFDVSRLRARSQTPPRLSTIHHPRSLPDSHVTMLDGLPVTTPVRTLFDLANLSSKWQLHPKKLERTLDIAWAKGLVNHRVLVRTLDELAERGRGGIRLMRELIGERGPGYRPPESGLEARFQAILHEHGLKPMQRQVDVGDDGGWLGRVDFKDPPPGRLIVQIDSERYHGALIDQQADDCQTEALTAAGFIVRRFTDVDVWYRPETVVAAVRAARSGL